MGPNVGICACEAYVYILPVTALYTQCLFILSKWEKKPSI